MNKSEVQIVDENDRIVGHKERSSVDFDKEYYRVAALWLRDSIGRVLIAQRKLTKDKDPGKWGPAVAGTVEQDETYESNIEKETEEEIGLTNVAFETGPKQRITEPRHYFCQWFYAQIDLPVEQLALQEDEVEQAVWAEPDDLKLDVENNPDKYIPIFPAVLRLLEPQLFEE